MVHRGVLDSYKQVGEAVVYFDGAVIVILVDQPVASSRIVSSFAPMSRPWMWLTSSKRQPQYAMNSSKSAALWRCGLA